MQTQDGLCSVVEGGAEKGTVDPQRGVVVNQAWFPSLVQEGADSSPTVADHLRSAS